METDELNIMAAIQDRMAESIKAGYEPKIVLMHPIWYHRLRRQIDAQNYFPNEPSTILGLKFHVTDLVMDFLVLDNRRWVDQKF